MKVPSLWKVAAGLALAAVMVWGASPVLGAGSASESEVVEHSDAGRAAEPAGEAAETGAEALTAQPGEQPAARGDDGEAAEDAAAEDAVAAEDAGEADGSESAPPWTDPDRAEKLARWDELKRRQAELRGELGELRRELARVNRELRALRRELWPEGTPGRRSGDDGEAGAPGDRRGEWITEEEWERLRRDWQNRTERFMEQLHERLRTMGEDLLPWVPDAVVEGLAERTGYTPEQVRELIRTGQWDQLFRRMNGRTGDSGAAEPAPDGEADPGAADGAAEAPDGEDPGTGEAPGTGGSGGADAAVNGTPIS